jgi:type II secretory pathway pseudopilin PulG
VICPNCAHDNPEGRKYCRACAKPLTAASESAPSQVSDPVPAAAAPTSFAASAPIPTPAQSKLNVFSVVSLVCAFFGIIIPFSLAAVIFGHLSRAQIARSGGRERGSGLAFAGLIMGYLELALFIFILLGFMGVVRDVRRHFNEADPRTRAALMQRLAYGDPNAMNPANRARQQEAARQALRYIRDQQTQYLTAHPGDGYVCQLWKVGSDAAGTAQLNTLLHDSGSDTKFMRCGPVPPSAADPAGGPMYVVISAPRNAVNAADEPAYCLDPLNGIEEYSAAQWRDALPAILTSRFDPCPQTGTHVE